MKYEKYKDSGVEWIGDIPANWTRSRLKFLFSHSNAGVWGEEEKGDENDIVCFRVADFDYQKGYLGFDKLTMRNITAKELDGRLLRKGSLLIEKSGGGDVTPVGRVVRFNYKDKATCSNFVHFVIVDESHNSDFLYYYFYAMYANKENLLYFNQTTGIQNLKVGEYLGQSIFVPSLQEQQAIANYLDAKCAKINGSIDVQKRKIELLNELKQTIITDAVTKGLNPNAPMKNSGVDWIGNVPEHWEVKRIKNISFGYKAGPFGSSLITSNLLDEGNILVYTPEHVANKSVDVFGNLYLPEERKAEMSQFIVSKDDIIFPIVGTLGRAMRITENMPNGIINQRLAKFKINDKEIDANYFLWLFGDSNFYEHYINLFQRGSIIVNLTKEIVGNMPILLPPLSEQQDIVNYLESETSKIDAQIAKANRRIELLNELKQSIITEVVTGKIKVC